MTSSSASAPPGTAPVSSTNQQQLKKSVSFLGMVALGLGGVWGTSWLVVSSSWMKAGGGVINAILAWVLIAVVELPFVLAYKQAVPMFPKAEGEMSYATAAFGRAAGFWAAWFGILVNLIVCAYEVVALVRMAGFLWPGVNSPTWYTISKSKVGPWTIVLGLLLVLGITALHLRGVNVSSKFTKAITTTLMVLTGIGILLALVFGSFGNYQPYFGKPMLSGIIAVAAMLPFSFAGWESIAKGAEEAADSKTSGRAVPIAWGAGWLAYVLSLAATGLVLPWMIGAEESIPFASGLTKVTGTSLAGNILVFTALLGVIGVYNALFYSMTRQMFGMARRGQLPGLLSGTDHKGVPRNAILFTTAILLIAPFLGRGFLLTYVDAASFAYIILWGLTFLAIAVLRRRYRGTAKEFHQPGAIVLDVMGVLSIIFMLVVFLYPGSPGALIWPTEHIVLAALILIGLVLYLTSRKSRAAHVDDEEEGR